jgi:hypothetical protein
VWNYSKPVNKRNDEKKIFFGIQKWSRGHSKITDMVLAMIE